MQHLVTFKGIWDFNICIALRNLFKNLWSVISDRLSTGEELFWLWERFSHWAVYFQMRSSESQDSEMVYGKQMSSCLCDSIFPLSYILPKRSAWLPRLLFAFWTNQLPSTVRSASSFGDEAVQKLLPRDMSSIQENTKAYWALKSSGCSFEKKSIEYSTLSEYLWSAYDLFFFFSLFISRTLLIFIPYCAFESWQIDGSGYGSARALCASREKAVRIHLLFWNFKIYGASSCLGCVLGSLFVNPSLRRPAAVMVVWQSSVETFH